jgi:hypothetical protein
MVEKREVIASIAFPSKCYLIHGEDRNINGIYDKIRQIERILSSEGFSVGYDAELDAIRKMALGSIFAILMVPSATKTEVINAGLRADIFHYKTTRHIIPFRPLFLNIPLGWLYDGTTLRLRNEKLVEYLSNKKVKHLTAGQIFDRRYEEELYIFE